jgi:hypothetical protein
MGMVHIRGDGIFRVNVPHRPPLDTISGALFLLGLGYLLFQKKLRPISIYLIIPIIIIILPSVSPVLPKGEIPNSGRTLGIIPYVSVIVAMGLLFISQAVQKLLTPAVSRLAIFLVILSIATLNLSSYFIDYPRTLPDFNSPFGKIIATYIDSLPRDTTVSLSACCWGAWGQPEPNGVYYVLAKKAGRENLIQHPFITECNMIDRHKPSVVILDPRDIALQQKLKSCDPKSIGELHVDPLGQSVFYSIVLPKK